ncbi:hypothetical protein [Ferrovibrio xuzhouensis]|uniref:Lectin-like protein BA14k n=1 Tax=Ferrovibrio xuzhouensis TaxID=1576914 RepID=A0ABV7VA97_9PROT
MSARTDFAVFLAIIAATLGVAIAVGPAPAARADEIVVWHDAPPPYWHRHPPYYYRHPPRHEVVVIEPAPPPVVVAPAPPPVVVAPAPAPAVAAAPEPYCREYRSTSTVDSKPVPSYGKACRQPDGSWKIVSQNP